MTEELENFESNQQDNDPTFLNEKEKQRVIEEVNHISFIINESDSKHSVNAGFRLEVVLFKSKIQISFWFWIQMLVTKMM